MRAQKIIIQNPDQDMEESGIKAIMELEAMAGWKSNREHATRVWRNMTAKLRSQALVTYWTMKQLAPGDATFIAHTLTKTFLTQRQTAKLVATAGRG